MAMVIELKMLKWDQALSSFLKSKSCSVSE